MNPEKPYKPSEEEIKKAEGMMIDEQKAASAERGNSSIQRYNELIDAINENQFKNEDEVELLIDEHPEITSTEFQDVLKKRLIDGFLPEHGYVLHVAPLIASNETLNSPDLQAGLKKGIEASLKAHNQSKPSLSFATPETKEWFESSFQEIVKSEIVKAYSSENIPYYYPMFGYATEQTKASTEVQEAVKDSIIRWINSKLGNVPAYGVGFIHDLVFLSEETISSPDLQDALMKMSLEHLGNDKFISNGGPRTEYLLTEENKQSTEYKRALYLTTLKGSKGRGWEKYLDDKNDPIYKRVYGES